jgi:thioredoxin-related protein
MFPRSLALCLLALSLLPLSAQAEEAKRGQILGGAPHTAPSYFKESFLEIASDVDEASEEGRHVMLFFQLNACPYCDRMLAESFEAEPNMSFIQEHFDVIAINVGGDREVAFDENTSVPEKQLAEMLKVRATPAIVFLNDENKQVVRVNGYRAPSRFNAVLRYVSSKGYESGTLADFMAAELEKGQYTPIANPRFKDITDLSSVTGPLLLIFEDSTCLDCAEFHERTLAREDVGVELNKYTIVRLNTDSEQEIIAPDGSKTTAKALAAKHEMIYRPGTLVFDDGELQRRTDSLVFHFHFKEGLRYVADGYYKKMEYRDYSEQRREELLSSGVDIDLGR